MHTRSNWHAWIDSFTLPKLGAVEVRAVRVLIVNYNFITDIIHAQNIFRESNFMNFDDTVKPVCNDHLYYEIYGLW